HGAAQLRDRVVQLVLVEQNLAQSAMSTGQFRIDRNRLPERRRRRLQLLFLEERHSQIVGSFEIGGIELQSPLQGRDGGIDLSGVGLRHAEIENGKRIVGTDLNRLL